LETKFYAMNSHKIMWLLSIKAIPGECEPRPDY
jgi:hypothetical protein